MLGGAAVGALQAKTRALISVEAPRVSVLRFTTRQHNGTVARALSLQLRGLKPSQKVIRFWSWL